MDKDSPILPCSLPHDRELPLTTNLMTSICIYTMASHGVSVLLHLMGCSHVINNQFIYIYLLFFVFLFWSHSGHPEVW